MALVIGNIKKLSVLVGALTIVGLVAGPAWAPKVFRRQVVGGSCTTSGVAGTFAGGLEVTHFTSRDGEISASGVLDGNCETSPGVWTALPIGQSVSLSLSVPVHDCAQGFVFDYTDTLSLPSMTITMSTDILVEVPEDVTRARRLCVAVKRYNEGRTEAAVRVLNTLLAASARDDAGQLEPK